MDVEKSSRETQTLGKPLVFSSNAARARGLRVLVPSKKQHGSDRSLDSYKAITELWVRLSQSHQYEELKQAIVNFQLTDRKMVDFFNQKGAFLLRCAILHWREPEALNFIYHNVPVELLKQALCSENYASLETRFLGESALEQENKLTDEILKSRLEKMKLLLMIDADGLKQYMESESSKKRYSTGIHKSFQQALSAYEAGQLQSPKY